MPGYFQFLEYIMSIIQHYINVHSVYKYQGRFTLVGNLDEALSLVTHNRMKAELIGTWLYCFATDLIGVQLRAIGFWFSFKHNAFVYSGRPKDGIADDETLDEIRARLGNQLL